MSDKAKSRPSMWYGLFHRFLQSPEYLPALTLAVVLVCIFAFRLQFVTAGGYFSADGKNYLVTMSQVFGNDVSGRGLTRPPLFALTVTVTTEIWGAVAGSRILSVLISSMIGWPFFLVMRRVVPPWIALVGALLFVLNPMYSEMLSWGYITFFGIFFSLFSFYFLLDAFSTKSRKSTILAGFMGSLVIGFHQTSSVIFIGLAFGLVVALAFASWKDVRGALSVWVRAAIAGGFLSLPYVPSYISQARNISGGYVGSVFSWRTAEQLAGRWHYFYGQHAEVWASVLVPALIGLWVLLRRDRNLFSLVIAFLVVPLGLNLLDAADLADRSAYFSYFSIYALFCVGMARLLDLASDSCSRRLGSRWPLIAKGSLILAMIAVLLIVGQTGQRQLSFASRFYRTLDDDEVQVAEWIAEGQLEPEGAIAVFPGPFSDWIRAIAVRSAFHRSLSIRGEWDWKLDQAKASIALFSGNQSIDNGSLRISTTYPYLQSDGLQVSLYLPYMGVDTLAAVDAFAWIDSQAILEYDVSQSRRSHSVSEAVRTDFQVETIVNGLCMSTTFIYTDLDLIRIACLEEGQPKATIVYTFNRGQSEGALSVRMPIQMMDVPRVLDMGGTGIVAQEQRALGEVRYEIATTGDGLQTQRISVAQDSDTDVSWVFTLEGQSPSIEFTIDVHMPGERAVSAVEYFYTPDVISKHDIRYVAVDRTPPLDSDKPGLYRYSLRWLEEAPYLFPIYEYGDSTLYRVSPYFETEPQSSLFSELEDGISLIGWTSPGAAISKKEGLDLLLFWQAQDQVTARYKVFLHLIDDQGEIVGQDDGEPCRWQCPTSTWRPGQTIVDKRTIPIAPDLSPGDYSIVAGMYVESTGQRLQAVDQEGRRWPSDQIFLGTISVVE